MKVFVAQLYLTLCESMYYNLPGPLSMGFSRQEDWSALPFLSPGDLPDPVIEPGSPALQAASSPSRPGCNCSYHCMPRSKVKLLSMTSELLLFHQSMFHF